MMNFEQFIDKLERTDLNIEIIQKGFEFGRNVHEGQFRKKSNLPYFTHPINVALLLKDKSVETIIAGLLHDVVEDTSVQLSQIGTIFGPIVGNLVEGMTKNPQTSDIFGPLEKIGKNNSDVFHIKLADRFDNLSDNILEMKEETQRKYLDKTPKILELAAKYGVTEFSDEINKQLEVVRNHLSS